MKNFRALFLLLFLYSGLNAQVREVSTPYSNPSEWEEVFLEDFHTKLKDSDNPWFKADGCGRARFWFDPSLVSVDIPNQQLVLTGKKEDPPNDCIDQYGENKRWAGSEVISGIDYSKYSGNHKYGFYEIKCKIPYGPFTSFWLSTKNGNSTYKEFPEIDIFELVWNPENNYTSEIMTSQVYSWDDEDNEDGEYEAIRKMNVTKEFCKKEHTIGCLWTPDYIEVYLDKKQLGDRIICNMRTDLKISLSYQISSKTITDNSIEDIKDPFLIDYVTIYGYKGGGDSSHNEVNGFSDPLRWSKSWYNRKRHYFNGLWQPRNVDKFYAGNINSSTPNKDELLIFRADNTPDSISLLEMNAQTNYWDPENWKELYSQGDGKFGNNWVIGIDDKLIVGDFSYDSRSGDDILLVSATKYAKLISYYNSTFNDVWGNGGPDINGGGYIGSWRIGSDDIFLKFDYNGDNKDELFSVSRTKYAKINSFNDGVWSSVWGNGGPSNGGSIGPWIINSNDQFFTGDFLASKNGDELLCVSATGLINLMYFNGKKWSIVSSSRQSKAPSSVIVGNFDELDTFDEILLISSDDGEASIYDSDLDSSWSNKLNIGHIHNWYLKGDDKYVSGKFIDDGISTGYEQLLAIRGTGRDNGDKDEYYRAEMFLSPLFFDLWPWLKSEVVEPVEPKIKKQSGDKLKVYPNPSKGLYYINTDVPIYIEVFNIYGVKILSRTLHAGSKTLDLSNFQQGLYIFTSIRNFFQKG